MRTEIATGTAAAATIAAQERNAGIKPYLPLRALEPYKWQTAGGKTLLHAISKPAAKSSTANTRALGQAEVVQELGEEKYTLETVNTRYQFHVAPACWGKPAADFAGCAKQLSSQSLEEEKAAQRKAEQAAKAAAAAQKSEAEYANSVKAGDNPLPSFGPLPPVWSEADYVARMKATMLAVKADTEAAIKLGKANIKQFDCKKSVQKGNEVDMVTVHAYLLADVESNYAARSALWGKLVQAADKGNWLARATLYRSYSRTSDDYVDRMVHLRLFEWLQQNKISSLYSFLAQTILHSEYYDHRSQDFLPLDALAAMTGSPGAQLSIGAILLKKADAPTQKIGKAMVECARESSAYYAKIVEKDFPK